MDLPCSQDCTLVQHHFEIHRDVAFDVELVVFKVTHICQGSAPNPHHYASYYGRYSGSYKDLAPVPLGSDRSSVSLALLFHIMFADNA